MNAALGSNPSGCPARVTGSTIVYRLFDVGYGIDLEHAGRLLAASVPERHRLVRGDAQALTIPNPPLTVTLAPVTIRIGDKAHAAEASARIFDFGAVSLRLGVRAPVSSSWREFAAFGNAVDVESKPAPIFQARLDELLRKIAPAVERRAVSPLTEDYVVFRVTAMEDDAGHPFPPRALRDDDVVRLLLAEPRPVSEAAGRDVLSHRFAYYEDDLAVVTWDKALVVEPNPDDSDVQYLIEFANAQLLELRVYDAILEAELSRMYGRIASFRARRLAVLRRYAPLLGELQTLVGDFTEFVERVENALKVTDDVYLARVYTTSLEIFRGREWRSGIDRRLAILRDTYAMMNAASQATRSEVLELVIIALIALEIVLAFVFGS